MLGRYKSVIFFCLAGTLYANSNYQTIIESGTPNEIISLNAKIAKNPSLSVGQIMQLTALHLVGQPYGIGLLDRQQPEYMYVSLHETDCMLFVEQVLSASELIKQKRLNLDNLIQDTKDLRYHGDLAYCNRNHYFKDWATVNIEKGYVTDEAYRLTHILFPYTADVMSKKIATDDNDAHKKDLACIIKREGFINQQKLGFIPLTDLPRYLRFIKSGDIIGIVRTPNGKADAVHHLGIAYVHDNVVSMIHASSKSGKVVIADTLTGYLGQYTDSQGIILLRPQLMHND